MSSLNRAIILGNLGQDPELRYTAGGVPVATLSVATNEVWVDASGEKKEEVTWHRVIVWSKVAENCAKYLAKGRTVLVEGRLQTRSWEDKDGQKKYVTEIVAQNVQFVGGNGAGTGARPPHPAETGTNPPPAQQQQRAAGQRAQQQQRAAGQRPQQQAQQQAPRETAFDGDQPGLDDIPF